MSSSWFRMGDIQMIIAESLRLEWEEREIKKYSTEKEKGK
jgi:predicted site-specific integrase-resolvase